MDLWTDEASNLHFYGISLATFYNCYAVHQYTVLQKNVYSTTSHVSKSVLSDECVLLLAAQPPLQPGGIASSVRLGSLGLFRHQVEISSFILPVCS